MTRYPIWDNPVARWVADETARARLPDLALFRPKALAVLPVLAAIPEAAVFFAMVSQTGLGAHIFPPVAGWLLAGLIWLVSVESVVRVRAGALVIDNMVVRHVIPWERFSGVSVEPGVGMFARLDDGRVVKSAAFGRSLGDALQGYARMRGTLKRVREACRAARLAHQTTDPPPPYRWQLRIPWAPLLGLLAVFEAFSWIAFAAQHG